MGEAFRDRVRLALWLTGIAAFGAIVVPREPFLLIGVPAGLALVALTLVRPEVATLLVVFALYSNIPVVAYEFHGVPKAIAASLPLLLGIPLIAALAIQRQKVVIDSVFNRMLLFGIVLVTSALMVKDREAAVDSLVTYCLEGLLLYFLLINVVREYVTVKRVIGTLLLAGSFMGGVTIFQEVTGNQESDFGGLAQRGGVFGVEKRAGETVRRQERAAGPVGEQNYFSQVLLVLVPLGLYRIREERDPRWRAAAIVATGLITGGMLLAFSRGAFVGLTLTIAVMIYLGQMRWRHALLATAAGCLLAAALAPSFFVRIGSMARAESLVTGRGPAADGAMSNRLRENLVAAHVFVDHPVFGVGPGQFVLYTLQYSARHSFLRQDNRRAHNLYLEIAAETGMPGLLVFLSILVAALKPLWRASRRLGRHADLASLAAALFLALFAYLASGVFLSLAYQRYFWLLVALCTATSRVVWREAARRDAVLTPTNPGGRRGDAVSLAGVEMTPRSAPLIG